MVEITGLYIHPVKGARPVPVDSVQVDETGFQGDREFAVFREGVRCNAKAIPALMFLEAGWEGSSLQLSYPDREPFVLENVLSGTAGIEAFRGGETPVMDMGDDVAGWLSLILAEKVRLCRVAKPTPFIIPLPEFTAVHGKDQTRFIDAAPLMLANQSSLDDLNQRLAQPVEMARFRPNIVVQGLAPYAEDEQATFSFDEVELIQVAPCERCAVVTMDLATAETGKEPLAMLAGYRRRENHYAGGVMFGTYLAIGSGGRLSVGQRLKD